MRKVVNDDGPPSSTASPYVHSFVLALRANGHKVSVVLPHVQRSWIGKAHFVHETARPTYFRPGTQHEDNGTTHDRPLSADTEGDEWVLVNGTPATCAQLGLFHFYKDRGPVDLVVSGPNFGRNSTSLFSLSSGTIGGAMEAACCGFKSIALSFAFDREVRYNREYIEAACRLGARLSEHLGQNWDEGTDLYNVNIPLGPDVENGKVYWTSVLQNWWRSGPSYRPIEEGSENAGAADDEAKLRGKEGSRAANEAAQATKPAEFSRHEHRDFKWVPSFADIHNSVKDAEAGTDGWAILNNSTR